MARSPSPPARKSKPHPTPEAWRQIRWRFSLDLHDLTPLEAYFNEFYYPDLLGDLYSPTRRPKALASIKEKDRSLPLVSDLRVSANGVDIPAEGVSPARDVTVSVRVSEARKPGGAQGGGVTDLRLFRNGVLVKIWKGDPLSPASGCALGGAGEAVCSAIVPVVEGDNRLLAYAFNRDNVKSEDAELTVRGPNRQQGAGRLYIIAVGINEYANKQFDLRLARPDALAFGRELERQQQSLGRTPDVVYLLDSEATKQNLLLALRRLVRGEEHALPEGAPKQLKKLRPAEPEDTVVIYFAGHGLAWPARPEPRQPQRFYFIPHNLGYSGPRTRERMLAGMPALTAHSLSDEEMEEVVADIDAESLLLVVDACNSGQVLESAEKRRGPLNIRGLAQLAYEKGMYVITASQSYQAARGLGRLGYGFLTYALIEEGLKRGLADAQPRDGRVLLREWFDYSAGRVPDLFRAEQRSRGPREKRLLVHDARPDAVPEVQQPRVFYRRESEAKPLVIANTNEQGARP